MLDVAVVDIAIVVVAVAVAVVDRNNPAPSVLVHGDLGYGADIARLELPVADSVAEQSSYLVAVGRFDVAADVAAAVAGVHDPSSVGEMESRYHREFVMPVQSGSLLPVIHALGGQEGQKSAAAVVVVDVGADQRPSSP